MNLSSRIVVVVTVVAMSVVVSSIAHGQASTKVPTILGALLRGEVAERLKAAVC